MTRRQQIIEVLQNNKQTTQQLANYFQCNLKDIIEDLEHIQKSIKPKKLKISPAYCRSCNFVFKERSKISKPSKCPRCKSEWIEAQMFWIEWKLKSHKIHQSIACVNHNNSVMGLEFIPFKCYKCCSCIWFTINNLQETQKHLSNKQIYRWSRFWDRGYS